VDLVKVLIDHGVDVMRELEYTDPANPSIYATTLRRQYTICSNLEKRARIVKYALWHTQVSFKIVISLMKMKDTPHNLFRCDNMNHEIISYL